MSPTLLTPPAPPLDLPFVGAPTEDALRAARRELRRQLAALDHELLTLTMEQPTPRPRLPGHRPRLLTFAELEAERDELVATVAAARERAVDVARERECNRRLLEDMLANPRRHKFARVYRADLGESGCGAYEVRPRLGLIGVLAGWWQVKLSSGCPLAMRLAAASA